MESRNPSTTLKKKDRPVICSLECQTAFSELKECLLSLPILGHRYNTDASRPVSLAILTQKKNSVREEVLSYASRTLNRSEINYYATESVLQSFWLLKSGTTILNKNLSVVTDHTTLRWALRSTKYTSRQIRWAL